MKISSTQTKLRGGAVVDSGVNTGLNTDADTVEKLYRTSTNTGFMLRGWRAGTPKKVK
ncbi:hypothetical protein [Corynebacterium sp.]|uniref:hypothetical protein n=1 Tax=Corynebacterium sp. TaxID=1720 RepID=UPI0026DD3865|nr:hypothetical protein [Corynebacterium sp.]MDO4915735.1 hypothetical protein [Corynebacterium sp.]